eukprot:1159068-Pelagomonas_calceolata.AAC.13
MKCGARHACALAWRAACLKCGARHACILRQTLNKSPKVAVRTKHCGNKWALADTKKVLVQQCQFLFTVLPQMRRKCSCALDKLKGGNHSLCHLAHTE